MRVLITTDWYEPVINGVVTSVMNLSRQLRERGHEVKILTLSRTFHSYIEGDVVYAGSIGLGCIYPQARLKIPKAAGDYMEMLLEWKPDIVHSQCEFSTFFLAKRIASELHVPIVHTYHTVYEDYTHYFSPQKVWGRNIVQLMTKKLANVVETLIAPSDKIRRYWKDTRCLVRWKLFHLESIWKNISYVKKKTGVKKSVCSLVYHRMHWCWYM